MILYQIDIEKIIKEIIKLPHIYTITEGGRFISDHQLYLTLENLSSQKIYVDIGNFKKRKVHSIIFGDPLGLHARWDCISGWTYIPLKTKLLLKPTPNTPVGETNEPF